MAVAKYSEVNLPTVVEVKEKWCFGLPLTDSSGGEMPEEDVQLYIDGAIAEVERNLGVYLKPTKIACNPAERGLVLGVDYDVDEPPYDYVRKLYLQWGFLQLRRRPILSLDYFTMKLPNKQDIIDFLARPDWVKVYWEQGQLEIVPYAGDPTLFAILGGTQTGYPFITGQMYSNLPQMFYVDYTAGIAKNNPAYKASPEPDDPAIAQYKYIVPADIRNIVGKKAAMDVLGIASEALSAGIASQSTSIDGLSESMSLTASAENTLYSAHIVQYQKEWNAFFKNGAARSSVRGITFTVI